MKIKSAKQNGGDYTQSYARDRQPYRGPRYWLVLPGRSVGVPVQIFRHGDLFPGTSVITAKRLRC
jgi:hypothetical protein